MSLFLIKTQIKLKLFLRRLLELSRKTFRNDKEEDSLLLKHIADMKKLQMRVKVMSFIKVKKMLMWYRKIVTLSRNDQSRF